MRKVIRVSLTVILLAAFSLAQQGTAPAKKPSRTPAKASAAPSKAAAAPAATPAADDKVQLPSEATVSAFLRSMFGYDQNLAFRVASIKPTDAAGISEATVVVNTPKGQQVTKLYITRDGEHAILGDLIPFGADPFAKDRAELERNVFGPTKGAKDATITLVEFGDLQCPACKQAQPSIEKLLVDVPNTRLVFQNFPLEQIHPWAGQAARYVDCLQRSNNDATWTFITAVYSHQGEITEANVTEKLNNYVRMAKGDPAAIAACASKPETAARIKKSVDLGNSIGITSTPTLFINGRRLGNLNGIPYETLKAMAQFEVERSSQK